jgi:hypothetical protein
MRVRVLRRIDLNRTTAVWKWAVPVLSDLGCLRAAQGGRFSNPIQGIKQLQADIRAVRISEQFRLVFKLEKIYSKDAGP